MVRCLPRLGGLGAALACAGLTGRCDPLAERQPVTAGHLDHEVAQAPGMVGQPSDDPRASGRAPFMQVIDAGDADIEGGGGVDAGAGRPDQRQPDRVAAQQHQAHLGLVHLDLEPERIAQERGSGRQISNFQVGPTAQELDHRRLLAARATRRTGKPECRVRPEPCSKAADPASEPGSWRHTFMVNLSAIGSHARAENGLTLSDWSWFAANAQIAAVRRCDQGELSSVVDAHIRLFCRVGGVAEAPVTAAVQPVIKHDRQG
jgi:hypothetical protein